MIIETLLRRYMRRQVHKLLVFPCPPGEQAPSPPSPDSPGDYLLYLHIPFCEGLCPYCSFNRIRLDEELAVRYFHALKAEMRRYHELGYRFSAAYVGGGTPTVMPRELEAVLRLARELWPIRSLSVETNPNHLNAEVLGLLKACGVDRLSVGVQSFDDELLRSIHRYRRFGSGRETRARLEAAQGRFRTLNVDLMYNFRAQSEDQLRWDLRVLNELRPDQVTYYPLMGPPSRRGSYARERRFYDLIRDRLASSYRPATAWCFTRASGSGEIPRESIDEYIVAHEEYAGLGSGSFSYLQGRLYANSFSVPGYIERLDRGLWPLASVRRYTPPQRLRYDFLMKLFGGRLDLDALERRHGAEAMRTLAPALAFFRFEGLLRSRGRLLNLTPRGYYAWVILMREFFAGVSRLRQDCLPQRAEVRDERPL
jgi:coproporphyrinogen III oxidase-like Fe-S oxidoreductase